jgi:hypothetical protein
VFAQTAGRQRFLTGAQGLEDGLVLRLGFFLTLRAENFGIAAQVQQVEDPGEDLDGHLVVADRPPAGR